MALFPNATLLASSWSAESLREVGTLLAEEAVAQQIHVVLGPTINLHRSLLGGRLFEAYSEDPLLTGQLAAAYVDGLQALGVGACLKHLVANESETDRTLVNSVVDEATLRELYLLPFEIAVEDAHPWSMMAAYNDVNGVPATEQDHVITEIVKGEWGWDGLVMSDWFATKTAAPAANGGLDLVMPGPVGPWGEALVAAVRGGEVDEAVIDEHLERLLRLASRVGALGAVNGSPAALHVPSPTSATRREQLTRLAAEGMTVLTNTGSVLPLAARPASASARVALIGRHALETIDMGGGSAQVNAPYQVSVADGLHAVLGDCVVTVDGVQVRQRPLPAQPGFVLDPSTSAPGVHVEAYGAHGSTLAQRSGVTASVMVGIDDPVTDPAVALRFRARLGAVAGQRVTIGGLGAGRWHVDLGGVQVEHVVQTVGFAGEEVLRPPAWQQVLVVAGDNPLLDVRVELPSAEVPHAGFVPLLGKGLYSLVAGPTPDEDDVRIARAVEVAARSDVAVVVVGLTEEQETEAVDKTTLHLPGRQDDLVLAVAAAAPRTVVVVNAATPVLMPWLDDVDAVLWAGLPGQEAGHAVAAALSGTIEPAGRLVTTFPAADAAAPAWGVTPVDGRLVYTERDFIGYRGHHGGTAPEPLFWFGHGLGYSTWEYTDLAVRTDDASPSATVTVTNVGARPSREVVQLYFDPADPEQPVRLVGWSAVRLDPGRSTAVEVQADPRMLRAWVAGAWSPLPPSGRFLVARGLGDVRAVHDIA